MHYFNILIEHFPYAGLFILLILGGIGLPFPEDATLILCGFLLSQAIIKPIPGLFAVYSGLLIADLLLYHFGRKFGRRIVTHKRFHRILSPERFSKIEGQFKRRGSLFILFGRHLVGFKGAGLHRGRRNEDVSPQILHSGRGLVNIYHCNNGRSRLCWRQQPSGY